MENIEKEIQARVEFKLREILEAVKNTSNANWNNAANTGSPKYAHYWEAFEQFKEILLKEVNLSPPIDEMAEKNKRDRRDKAVDKIMNKVAKRGDRDYYFKEKIVVLAIESAQNW